jgi:hypothetical protein
MARKNVKTSLTVTDFRSWLEGVEDMQGDDWSPSLEQWKKIRSKIELLEEVDLEEIISSVKTATVPTPTQTTGYINTPQGPIPRPAPFPTAPSFLEDPAAQPKLTTVMPSRPNSIIGSSKTPDIETSGGEYTGAFV